MQTADLRKKVHEIIDASDDEIIQAVYILLQKNNIENVLGTNIDQYNNELNEAETAINSGKYITHEDLKKRVKY